ncbi:MAG: Asp23/Gls24 family envelope stress response protein [Bacillota bacterium]|jgi:uncharacterized alkaline shock family protein YloU|nr:Asp23/Gls24 family envelope stress response protein [Clostridia bacterium]
MMEVYALVGPSGTGKSHHALYVAQEYGINMIIDDGLLIKGSRILAGRSAKRSPTRVGAIRTALFSEDSHAQEIMETIKENQPANILVLGTSLGMVEKIIQRLELPPAKTIFNIEDIASQRQIKKAQQIRNRFGTHVVPAPTVEVKPKFSGTIIAPLRSFFKKQIGENQPLPTTKHLWVEQTIVRPTFNYLGRFYIANHVISEITKYACHDIPGIDHIGKIHVDNSEHGLRLHIDSTVIFGYIIPDVLKNAQEKIKEQVEQMTSLHIISVDMHAVHLVFDKSAESSIS